MPDTLRQSIREFVLPRLPGVELDDQCDIFALGLVNSLFAMELVLFIEKLLGRQIPRHELVLDHFRSIDAMAALAGRSAQAVPQPAGRT